MLNVKLVSNTEKNILNVFLAGLASHTHFDWASAYASHAAYDLISNEFRNFLKQGGKSRAVFDLAQGLTDPEIIEELMTVPGDSECKVFVGNSTTSGIFHHKFYNFYNTENACLLLGSANFTRSGLTDNNESALVVHYDADQDLYKDSIDFFQESIWDMPGAVSPLGNQEIIDLYKGVYSTRKSFQSNLSKQLKELKKEVDSHHSYLRNYKNFTPFIAYLCGVICANAKYNNTPLSYIKRQRTINLNFRGQPRNRGTEDEGYVCTRVDDKLLGGIRLAQIPTQVESMKRFREKLQTELLSDSNSNQILLEDHSQKQTNVKITLIFGHDSEIWNHVLACISEFTDKSGSLVPSIPQQVWQSKDSEIIQSFIEGYFDFRARVSIGDRLPNGPMRIGVQIDTKASDFADRLKDLLDRLGVIRVDINDGTARDKDRILRITADQNSNRLFATGYNQVMARAYAEYNQDLG